MSYTPPGGWSKTPPSPLLEALDMLGDLRSSWNRALAAATAVPDGDNILSRHGCLARRDAYAESYRILRDALEAEYVTDEPVVTHELTHRKMGSNIGTVLTPACTCGWYSRNTEHAEFEAHIRRVTGGGR